jgi:hypothetical protein
MASAGLRSVVGVAVSPPGRPPLAPKLVSLIEQISRKNPLWSRRRITSELAKLGRAVDKDTGDVPDRVEIVK